MENEIYTVVLFNTKYTIKRNTDGKLIMPSDLQKYKGVGTALKPALEPITVARKPLSEKTVAENVLKWGTGGINIDGSRVEGKWNGSIRTNSPDTKQVYGDYAKIKTEQHPQGRFPANLIHDGSEEVFNVFPETKSGKVTSDKSSYESDQNTQFLQGDSNQSNQHGDSGNASRFFYCAKASKTDRNEGLDNFEDNYYELKDNVTDDILLEIQKYL